MKLPALPAAMPLLRIACALAFVGLALMVWSVLDPRPPPVLIAMSLGQAIGTLSLALYAFVIIRAHRAP